MATRQEELDAKYAGYTVSAEAPSAVQNDFSYDDPDYRDPRLEEIRTKYDGYTAEPEQPNERDYGWGYTAAFMRGFERLRSLPDVAQGDYEELAQHMGNLADYELDDRDRQRMEELQNTDGWWEGTKYYLQNPSLIGQIVAESLPMMAAPIVGAIGGGVAGGAAGTAVAGPPGTAVGTIGGAMVGGGLGSYATDYFATMSGFFGEEGIDMTDAQALKDAFQNEDLMVAARENARAHGIPVAIFDGLSMGLAGRIGKPIAGLIKGATGKAAGVTAELGMQAGFGMAGEAGGQINQYGEITDIPGVLAEGFGEIVPGFVEAGVSGYLDRRNDRLGRNMPDDSPLAALLEDADPIVQFIEDMKKRHELGLPIPETRINPETSRLEVRTADGWRSPESVDIDAQTGEAVLRRTNVVGVEAAQQVDPVTGESIVDQDILDVQLEDALLDLQMDLEGEGIVFDVAKVALDAAERKAASTADLDAATEERAGLLEQAAQDERDAAFGPATEQAAEQAVAEDQGAAATSEMTTPQGVSVEGEPVDVSGAQPATEGQILPEGVNPVGGRPLTTSMADALRGAGIVPPDDEGPSGPGGGGTPAQRGPDVTAAETRAAEALESEAQSSEERAAIQGEGTPTGSETDFEFDDSIPFEPLVDEFAEIDALMREVQPGGGVSVVPDQNYQGGESDPRNDDGTAIAPTVRTPSTNPAWMQGIVANEKVGLPYIENAIAKAKAGKRLGAKQQRIIDTMKAEAADRNAAPAPYEDTSPEIEQARHETDPMPEGSIISEARAAAPEFALEQEQDGVVPEAPAEPAAPQQQVDADIGVPGDMFSPGANAQVDLVDEARKESKKARGVPPNLALKEMKPSELNALASEVESEIEDYVNGVANGMMDETSIVAGIQKLKLHGAKQAEELEIMARAAISSKPTTVAGLSKGEKTLQERFYRAEELHEKWRKGIEDQDPYRTEVAEVKQLIDDMAAAGDVDAFQLALDHDWWTHWGETATTKDQGPGRKPIPIRIKTTHERFKKARKSNKYGTVSGLSKVSAGGVSVDVSQLSWTVPYDSLTFETKQDKARLDRIIDIYNQTHDKPVPGTAAAATAATPTNGFVIDEKKFEEQGPDTEERVFSSTVDKKNRKGIDIRLKNEGNEYISLEEADEKIQSWEDHAIAQGKRSREAKSGSIEDNSQKVIISLFDTTGVWANPYALAGYDVRALDIKDGIDVTDFSTQFMDEMFNNFEGKEVYGIIAACPCTTFSNSSTKWRRNDLPVDHTQNRHENADPVQSRKWIEKMWGKEAADATNEDGTPTYATPHDYAISLVHKTMQTLEYLRPQFWSLENPEGRIETSAGLPGPWRTGFQPSNFGQPYTKRTLLWGEFNEDLPTANVDPVEGSKMHQMSPSEDRAAARSETPEGFAGAFFMANNFQDDSPVNRTKKDYWYIAGAVEEAFRAGVTEEQIRENVYLDQSYEPENASYEDGKETIRELIAEANGGPPATPGAHSPASYNPPTPPTAPVPSAAEIDAAANEADPDGATDAQKKAGNYKKGHMTVAGLDVAIENPIGTKRYGNLKLKDHYGYIKRTVGKDGDQVDVFVNSKAADDFAGDVYVVDQVIDGKFDEHKVMLGYNNMLDARRAYKRNYNKGWKGDGAVTKMTLDEFKAWLDEPGANDRPSAQAALGPESPAFKKWFGKSKVVDKKGKPIIVYHGTQDKAEFYEFDPQKGNSFGGWNGFGTWFSNKAEHAYIMANRDPFVGGEGRTPDIGRVIPSYVSIQKPLNITFDTFQMLVSNLMKKTGGDQFTAEAGPVIRAHLQKLGYDGVIIENFEGDGKPVQDVYVALESNQIKSASVGGNSGAYSKSNNDIRFSSGKDLTGAPTMDWIVKVLAGKEGGAAANTPDTMPLNVAVSELLAQRERQEQQDATPYSSGTVINEILDKEAEFDKGISVPNANAPLSKKRLDRIVGEFNKEFPLANIHIANRNDPAVKKLFGESGVTGFNALNNLTVPALYDPNDGRIWIFKDRLPNLFGVKKLALHEMTHRGLDVMFDMHYDPQGKIDFNRLMEDVYQRTPAKWQAKLKRIETEYGVDNTVGVDRALAAEELIANLAETDVKDNLVSMVVEFIRKFLEKIGIITAEDAWTNQDIRDLITEAHGSLKGKMQKRNATVTEEVTLDSTGEVFEVERRAGQATDEIDKRIEICGKLRKCL
jgi:hypothetical protein